jgi:hypothetical protein
MQERKKRLLGETVNEFCCICNGRELQTFNNRVAAECSNCGSLERHRAFALFLMSLPKDKERKFCLLGRSSGVPPWLGHLSLFASFEVLKSEEAFSSKKKYQGVFHDHILHGSDEFFGIKSYTGLIEQVDGILEANGVQVFTVGAPNDFSKILSGAPLEVTASQDHVFAPDTFEERPTPGHMYVFNPTFLFGDEIEIQAGIQRSGRNRLTVDHVFFRIKG